MQTSAQCVAGKVAQVLLIIAGLHLGLVEVGMLLEKDWNFLVPLLEYVPGLEPVFFVLVGVSALLQIVSWSKCCGGKCPSNRS